MTIRERWAAALACAAFLAAFVLPPLSATETAPAVTDIPKPVLTSLESALDAYEELRAALVRDDLDALSTGAEQMTEAFAKAIDDRYPLPEEVKSLIEEAAFIVESVGDAEDLDAARSSFAELSRRFLQLAESEPGLTEGWHVFSCPMVDTFDKWIQPGAELENPYMGSEMPTCGTSSDWSVEPAESWLASAAHEGSPDEPAFEPGIPGIKMVDVRDYKFLWRELDELQRWERGERITIAEYRSKAIEKTAHFLELEGQTADDFAAGASEAVAAVRASFKQRQQPGPEHVGSGGGFSDDLGAAAEQLTSLLDGAPRHQLFAPEAKKWLLKLAFGPREDKETREAQQVKKL
jgi:hypothetical protein